MRHPLIALPSLLLKTRSSFGPFESSLAGKSPHLALRQELLGAVSLEAGAAAIVRQTGLWQELLAADSPEAGAADFSKKPLKK